MFATRSEGGVWHGSNEKCGEAAFLYLPQSAVVIPGESSRHADDAESEKDESDPPQNRGVM